jgi:hypothetical protein
MDPRLLTIYYALWIAHPLLQSAVAVAMLRRGTQKKFPYFFSYIVASIVMFTVSFPVYLRGSYQAYFYVHWITSVVTLILGFLVIREIFMDVFRPYHTLRDLGNVLFTWAALVMLMVAAVVAAASPPSSQGPIVEAVLTLQRSVRVTQCGLIMFLLVFSKYLGVSWKQHSFGIALGFGGVATVELAIVALCAASRLSDTAANISNMVAYSLFILVWFGYAVVNREARETAPNFLMTERWDRSLSDLQHPAEEDSLIPIFEGMVERAFSRTQTTELEVRVHELKSAERSRAASAASGSTKPLA